MVLLWSSPPSPTPHSTPQKFCLLQPTDLPTPLCQVAPPTAASIVANGVNGVAKPEADAPALAATSSDEPADAATEAPEAGAQEDGAEVRLYSLPVRSVRVCGSCWLPGGVGGGVLMSYMAVVARTAVDPRVSLLQCLDEARRVSTDQAGIRGGGRVLLVLA